MVEIVITVMDFSVCEYLSYMWNVMCWHLSLHICQFVSNRRGHLHDFHVSTVYVLFWEWLAAATLNLWTVSVYRHSHQHCCRSYLCASRGECSSSSVGPVAKPRMYCSPVGLLYSPYPPPPVWTFPRSPPGTSTSPTTREILVAKGGTMWARIGR